MKRVLIIANQTESTKHSRLLLEKKLLQEKYEVDVCYTKDISLSKLDILLEALLFKFVDLNTLKKLKSSIENYDFIMLYGLRCLLSLLFSPKKYRSKIVYQSLNNDVEYIMYELVKRISPLALLKWIIVPTVRNSEKKIAKQCRSVLVNSNQLKKEHPYSILNFYTSPLENCKLKFKEENPFAIIYLGQIREEKVIPEIWDIIEKYKLPFFIYGIILDNYIKEKIEKYDNVKYVGNFTADELQNQLIKLSDDYNLLGASLIQDVHKSYSFQDANKDIDYLAMSIPVLGNYRNTTRERIEIGCGYFYDKLPSKFTFSEYKKIGDKCKSEYEVYNNESFKSKLYKAFV